MAGHGALGLDGCPGGWAAVHLVDGRVAGACVVATVAAALARFEPAAVGVDMPIGLTDDGRPADTAARRVLGRAASAVFNAPPRCVVDGFAAGRVAAYEEANALARQVTGRGLSRQTWALVPKTAEVEAAVAVGQVSFVEVHPEVQFRLLAGSPLPRKTSWAGIEARRALLAGCGVAPPADLPGGDRVAPHDVLDAAVTAWVAAGLEAGEPLRPFPDDPPPDPAGRPIAIWARELSAGR